MAAQQYRTIGDRGVLQLSASSNPALGYLLQGHSPTTDAVLDTGPGSRTIAFADQYGTPGHEVYGGINVGTTPTNQFPLNASLTVTHGVTLSYGNLAIGGDTGGYVALDGASTITNDSAFLATGGRYLNGPFVLNGSMTVSNQSTADFRHATLEGHGTVNVEAGSVVDMNTVLAGLHVNVAKGGDLLLQGLNPNGGPTPSFHGTINEAAGGTVLLYGAQSAVREIFHTATGTLDLLNKAGTQIASLQFAPGSREYTEVGHAPGGPANNQFAVITTTPTLFGQPAPASVALPTIFTH